MPDLQIRSMHRNKEQTNTAGLPGTNSGRPDLAAPRLPCMARACRDPMCNDVDGVAKLSSSPVRFNLCFRSTSPTWLHYLIMPVICAPHFDSFLVCPSGVCQCFMFAETRLGDGGFVFPPVGTSPASCAGDAEYMNVEEQSMKRG